MIFQSNILLTIFIAYYSFFRIIRSWAKNQPQVCRRVHKARTGGHIMCVLKFLAGADLGNNILILYLPHYAVVSFKDAKINDLRVVQIWFIAIVILNHSYFSMLLSLHWNLISFDSLLSQYLMQSLSTIHC